MNVQTGVWIPCNADNPPPAIPDGMLMAVWYTYDYSPYPLWVDPIDNEWATVGQPGEDFSHYLLVPKPEGAK